MINKITQEDLAKHTAWLRGKPDGVRVVTVSYANLSYANLRGADLSYADLSYADLSYANLSYANLRGADLRDADLRDAKSVPDYVTAITSIVSEGDLVVYKQLQHGDIATLKIPASARRSNATGRKCRAEYAEVLAIQDKEGGAMESGVSWYDNNFVYRVGETVHPHEWCEDRWQECAGGIHFYLTRYEAQND